MYKILLADNEGVVLDSLRNMIYSQHGENCDIRCATTAKYTRRLARKFLPDIAIINVEMPGMHGFDVIKEIRSFHIKCVFITVSTYDRAAYRAEAEFLNVQAHLTKPLFRKKVMPPFERVLRLVSGNQQRMEKSRHIQEKFDAVIPVLEQGFISCLFFNSAQQRLTAGEQTDLTLEHYRKLMNFPQTHGRIIRLTFGELPEDFPAPSSIGYFSENLFQNLVGSSVRMQKRYADLCRIIKDVFPLAIIGSIMSNRLFFLLPYWNASESAKENRDFSELLNELLETLNRSLEGIGFVAETGAIKNLADIHLPEDF